MTLLKKRDEATVPEEQTEIGWYCARTKPKHEHIAAANMRRKLGLEVFHPRLRIERRTRRGMVRVNEPLFPCYVFVRCAMPQRLNEVQHTVGVCSVVRFNQRMPTVSDAVIEDLKSCFDQGETKVVRDLFAEGKEVFIGQGAFAGWNARVMRVLPSRERVEVLLELLGRLIHVEVDQTSIALKKRDLADLAPELAARD